MNALYFAMWMYFVSNPHYHDERVKMPLSLSLAAYVEAQRYDSTLYPVHPEELMGILLHEHGDRAPDRHDSKGDNGASLGLYQLTAEERREYNEAYGTAYKRVDLFDPYINTAVAAFAVHDYKRAHAEKRYCKHTNHTWWAHQKCPFSARETCKTRDRERTTRILSGWKRRAFWR